MSRNPLLRWTLAAVLLGTLAWPGEVPAARCGTGLRAQRTDRFPAPRPALRGALSRGAVPVAAVGASVHTTEHFRVLWGERYDRSDPLWAVSDGATVPRWVHALAQALEEALTQQRAEGFPEPFGVDRYYLDAYIGNTGVAVDGHPVTISSNYYAYTEIDPDFQVAYFVFNDDFSQHTDDPLGVLRATAAHELFHAVQRSWYPWDDAFLVPDRRWEREGWWFEATATWVEELFAPEVDDYVSFVRSFLETPERSLSLMDGRREYGAAIFPGYLWLRRGGADLWAEAFSGAFAQGLESSLDAALRRRDASLVYAVAEFWSLAAHPEDLWPDGGRYRSVTAPRFLAAVEGVPAERHASGATAPRRLGASLLRLDAPRQDLAAELWATSPGSRWLLGLSANGSGYVEVVEVGPGDGPYVLEVAADEGAFLAVVNVSAQEGSSDFRLELTRASAELVDGPAGRDGAGGGGCFLRALGW